MGIHGYAGTDLVWQVYNIQGRKSNASLEYVKEEKNPMSLCNRDLLANRMICSGCSTKILDRFYLVAVNRPWHSSCLRCAECKILLESKVTCFERNGNIFCKEDYYRLFSVKKCARCQVSIAVNELVMRARQHIYHIHCFACTACGKILTKGEQFGMKGEKIFCRLHFESLHQGYYETDDPMYSEIPMPVPEYYSSLGMVNGNAKCRTRKRKGCDVNVGLPPHGLEMQPIHEIPAIDRFSFDMTLSPGAMSNQHQNQRTKRMRTSFKHHQLRTMKSYFALNQNPDAKDLKQLAQKTGLSKRVLQVWFQNARAKWRRTVVRQEGQQNLGNSPEKSPTSPTLSIAEIPTQVIKNVPKHPQFLDITNSLSRKDSECAPTDAAEYPEIFG